MTRRKNRVRLILPESVGRSTCNFLRHHLVIQTAVEDLFEELIRLQERESALLARIEEHLQQLDEPSLQQAFQQRKSAFIRRSKERVERIYSQRKVSHQRIIPSLRFSDNAFLQEKRQLEFDRLAKMIVKHQNRQNAKIYGNLVKNRFVAH